MHQRQAAAVLSAAVDPDRFIRTDAVTRDLSRRTVTSGAIQLSAQAAELVLFIGSGIALARLLTPADFGLFAMAAALLSFVRSFKDFGLTMATVHAPVLEHRQVSALFWFSVRAALAASVERMTKWIYLSQGRTDQQLRWGLLYTPVLVLAVVAGVPWGAVGVATGFAAGTALLVLPGLVYCVRGAAASRTRRAGGCGTSGARVQPGGARLVGDTGAHDIARNARRAGARIRRLCSCLPAVLACAARGSEGHCRAARAIACAPSSARRNANAAPGAGHA